MAKKTLRRLALFIIFLSLIISQSLRITNLVQAAQKNSSTHLLKNRSTIVLDAGHGGKDPGALGISGSKEKDNNLALTLKLGKYLKNNGINVIYTRTSDYSSLPTNTSQSLKSRVAISNKINADMFISIHNNSCDTASVNGVETFYHSTSAKGKSLAQIIQSQIANSLHLKDRGIRPGNYYVLRNSKAVSVLVEVGYITNKNDENKIKSSSYQDKYAQAICSGILKYLNK